MLTRRDLLSTASAAIAVAAGPSTAVLAQALAPSVTGPMTETFFKMLPLTADEAAKQDYERLHVDLGDPTLNFATYARRRSLVLRRAAVTDIAPAGVKTVASIYVPETRADFTTSVEVFVFDSAIEAQPCADQALIARGYEPLKDTDQHGLFVGGSIGIFSQDGRKLRGARSHSVVRGRRVVTLLSEFPIDQSPAALVESGALIANLAFDDGRPPGFDATDLASVAIPVDAHPLAIAYPANWSITANGFVHDTPPGTVQFAVGDAQSPNGLMTFGVRQDATVPSKDVFDSWATRIAGLYVAENPDLLGTPWVVAQGPLRALENSPIKGVFYIFHLDNLKFHRVNQIRLVLLAEGDRRWTLSLLTDVSKFEDLGHFLVYALGVTGHETMVDSTLRALTGRGMERMP